MKKTVLGLVLAVCLVNLSFPAAAAPTEAMYSTISVGGIHVLAIKGDGSLWAWGDNSYGQIGDGTVTTYNDNDIFIDGYFFSSILDDNNKKSPVKIMDDTVAAYAGSGFSMAIRGDGSLWAWGFNAFGQLGDGTDEDKHIPVKIMDDVTSVSMGVIFTLAVKKDGSLWGWGHNFYGQLGIGTRSESNWDANPIPVKIMEDVVQVSAGGHYAAAVKSDGSLWTWGENRYGQLGDGTVTYYDNVHYKLIDNNKLSPQKIMDDVVQVSTGSNKTMAIKSDGSLWAWGWGGFGQLGNGTEEDKYLPVKIMEDVVYVSSERGSYFTMAIKNDGSLWGWGLNFVGILVRPENSGDTVSVPVKIMEDIIHVDVGVNYATAIKKDGSFWIWGEGVGSFFNSPGLIPKPLQIKDIVVLLPVTPPKTGDDIYVAALLFAAAVGVLVVYKRNAKKRDCCD